MVGTVVGKSDSRVVKPGRDTDQERGVNGREAALFLDGRQLRMHLGRCVLGILRGTRMYFVEVELVNKEDRAAESPRKWIAVTGGVPGHVAW